MTADPAEYDEDYWCCALKEGHEGCCAYRCSNCNGSGHMGCLADDLGCDCGLCDGDGYCFECSGHGFFNEAGDPCFVGRDEVAS